MRLPRISRVVLLIIAAIILFGLATRLHAMLQDLPQLPPKPDAYPGQSQHKEPPPGWVCEKDAKDPAHDCHCQRHFIPDPDDKDCCHDIMEDRGCSSYCWPKHCHCPVGECKVGDHHDR